MLSSCLGKSFREFISDLWEALVLSGRSGGSVQADMRRRRDWGDPTGEYEMEYRGRERLA